MKFVWLVIAGVAIALAAIFLLIGDFNSAFVVAAIGLVSWFLNYRAQLQDAIAERELREESNEEENSENEADQ